MEKSELAAGYYQLPITLGDWLQLKSKSRYCKNKNKIVEARTSSKSFLKLKITKLREIGRNFVFVVF